MPTTPRWSERRLALARPRSDTDGGARPGATARRRRSPPRAPLSRAALLVAILALAADGQSVSDRAWVPQPAESLRELSDAVERARLDRSARREREALLRLAERLLEEVPDGGFTIGAGRWIGPGAYLAAAALELSEADRRRFTEDLDLLFAARLDRAGESAPIERWLRDLPVSARFDPLRARINASLLEAGRAESWLDQVRHGWPPGAEIEASVVARWLDRSPPPPVPLARPSAVALSARWPAPGDPRSPWRPGAVRSETVVAGDRVYLSTPDGVHCWRTSGEEAWFFPFESDGPPTLPGSVRRPALCGRTLVVTTERGILGLDRETGAIRFEIDGRSLFPAPAEAGRETAALEGAPPRGDEAEPAEEPAEGAAPAEPRAEEPAPAAERRAAASAAGNPILAISPPARSERGAVVVASRMTAGSLDLRIILVDPEGRTLWNRDVGSAIGATHLALGSVLPAPAPRGDQVTVSTQRGALLTFSLIDGGLLWAAPYSGFAADASRDALRNEPRPRDARVEVDDELLYLTALDAANLQLWRRGSGALLAALPLAGQRWWGLAPARGSTRSLLLVSDDRVTPWEIDASAVAGGEARRDGAAGLRSGAPERLEEGLPRFSGPPLAVDDGWWVPHESGIYHLDLAGRVLEVVDFSPPGPVREIERVGEGILIGGDGFIEMRLPAAAPPGTLAALWGEIARGELAALPDPLPAPAAGSPEARAEEERVARTVLWQLRRPGVEAALRRRVTPAAVARIVRGAERARVAVREAIAAARRDERELAVELSWLALAVEDPNLLIAVDPLGEVPIELVVRQVLARLRDADERLPGQDRLEALARERLASGGARTHLDLRLETFARAPGTAVARRAALDAAEELYLHGNIGRSLDLLERLVLYEPRNAEAVEARFRIAELSREIGDTGRARELIDELVRDYGDLALTITSAGAAREWTVRARAERLRAELPPAQSPAGPGAVALPLEPAWRVRTELEHLRNLVVHPLADGSGRFLTISRRSIELREARQGDRLWHRTLPPIPAAEHVPVWSDVGRLMAPIHVDAESIWLTDRRELFRISLEEGRTLWTRRLPPLPGEEGEPVPNPIEGSACGEGVLLAYGGDGELRAFAAATGVELWRRPLAGPLAGPMQLEGGRVLLGIAAPPRVELRSIADGELLWSLDVKSLGTTLAGEPRFVPAAGGERSGDVCIAFEGGEIRRIDPDSGDIAWARPLPHLLRRVHRPATVPFWIAELEWARDRPALIGFDPITGEVLWQKILPGEQRRIHELIGYDRDLYLVEGEYNQRRALCLEVPRSFPAREPGEVETRELKTRWQWRLTQSWDVPHLTAHQDWILIEDSASCDLTILSRETGNPIPAREGFESVAEFLRDRQRLTFAGFIEDTLILWTARGGLGLRSPRPIRARAELWARLAELPLGGSGEPSGRPIADAGRAYRAGHAAEAVTLLERALEEPGLGPARRRGLLYRIEGFAEEVGERAAPEWRVPRVEIPPVVDGSLEEAWNAATAWPIENARYFHPIQGYGEDGAEWRGPGDLSLVLLAAWSDVGFHLALDVSDDSIHPFDRELERWNGDCLLLAFDFLGDGGLQRGADDQLLTLALTVPRRAPPGGAAGGAAGAGGAGAAPAPKDEDPEGEYQVQRKGDGSGLVYEVMVPWKTFRDERGQPALPHPNLAFRLNLVLTDDDGQGATTYMSLTPGQMLRDEMDSVWNIYIPERFPKIILGR